MTAYLGQGATITIGSPAVAIGQILSIDGPTMERTMVDTTNLGTTTLRTFLPGFGDGGEISVEVQYDHDDDGQEDVFESLILGSSTLRTFVPGFGDGGEVTLEAQFDNDDNGQQDVLESFEAGSATAEAIVITTSDSDTFSFNAYVRSFSISQNMDEVNRVTMVLKVSGDVTHASA